MSQFSLTDILADAHHDARADLPLFDVPTFADTLPDGRAAIVAGDIAHDKAFRHEQGDNIYGFKNDCGLVACQIVLQEFGHAVSETDVVRHAVSAGECEVISDDPN